VDSARHQVRSHLQLFQRQDKAPLRYYLLTFIIALLLTVVFTFGVYGPAKIDLLSCLNGLNWLVAFYLMPFWLGRKLIFYPMERGLWRYLIEFSLLWLLFIAGFVIKELLNSWYAPLYQSSIADGISISFFWALLTYISGRCCEFVFMWLDASRRARKANSDALRYQMNPHLLFNSINTISCFIHTDPDKADFLLHQLARILRSSLDLAKYDAIPLSEELTLLESYMAIEHSRFKFEFNLHIDREALVKDTFLPPFFIQPLIENTLKHNGIGHPLVIQTKIWLEQQFLCILVQDNGRGYPEQVLAGDLKGVGLVNLKERLKAVSNGSSIELSNLTTGGARTLIRINQNFYRH
jgi:two-component system LytT family sensor kinase